MSVLGAAAPVTVTVRSVVRDRHGDPTPGATRQVSGCLLAPRASAENTDRADQVTVGLTLLAPPGTVIAATDQVLVGLDVYDVEGEPADWRNPLDGWHPGVQVALTRTSG